MALCCIIMELDDNALPQFSAQQNSLITLTEGKCLYFPFKDQRQSGSVWSTCDIISNETVSF